MSRIAIPVSRIEFDDGGSTLWVHNNQGATVLRIKLERGVYRAQFGCENICSHADIYVRASGADESRGNDVVVCLVDAADADTSVRTSIMAAIEASTHRQSYVDELRALVDDASDDALKVCATWHEHFAEPGYGGVSFVATELAKAEAAVRALKEMT